MLINFVGEASNQVDTRACTECGLLNPATFTKCQTCGGKLGDKGIVVFQKDTKNNDSVIDETKSGYESQKGAELVDNHHEFEKAISHLDEAIRLNPNNVFAWNYKADALNELGRFDEAKECFAKSKQLEEE
jgi:tetratricopeptide (TPR) repeat protein